jgi:hypothetical protein
MLVCSPIFKICAERQVVDKLVQHKFYKHLLLLLQLIICMVIVITHYCCLYNLLKKKTVFGKLVRLNFF